MLKTATGFTAAALGLGLFVSFELSAQTTTSGTASGQTTATTQAPSRPIRLQDGKALIGASLSTTGGRYGAIVDVVFDGSGSVQYVVVERQGQFHPVPFSLLRNEATGDVSVSLSSATLDAVTVDRNNLQSLSNQEFATQLRTAFGPNVARTFLGQTTAANADANSTAGARNQVFSLSSLLGGTINAQNGEAGTISSVAITPNGQVAFMVGSSGAEGSRFAFPFSVATVSQNGSSITVNTPTQALSSVTIPSGSFPNLTDQSFVSSFQTAFGNQALRPFLGSTAGQTSPISLRDARQLIGGALSTTAGQYGTIADLVTNGAGMVQYALVERNGQLHPVPFSMLQMGANGQVSVNVPATALDALTVDRNNLSAMTTQEFFTQLQTAFGADVARSIFNPAGVIPGTGAGNANANSTAGLRGQLFSLGNLLGDPINAQGGQAGTLSNLGISPNGQIIIAIGNTFNGDVSFAFPFSMANVGANGESLTVDANSQTLTSVTVPSGTLPSLTDQSFTNSFAQAFGQAGRLPGMTKQESDVARRNDQSNQDPVARAGDSSRGGADAVAGAGDPRRGGVDAVSRAGDRAMPGGTRPTTTGTTTTGTASDTTAGGIVNLAQDAPPLQERVSTSGLLQMRDLLNFRIQAQDGAFGRVSDVVFDRNGNIQFLLGNSQGQTFPLPFTPTAFTGAPNTLTFDVPISRLQQLAINPQSLPTLQNQAFVERMRQVFGDSFGSNVNTSFFPPNTGTTGTTGTGTDRFPAPDPRTGRQDIRPNPITKSGTTGGTGTGTTASDSWTWPTGADGRFPAPDPRTGREDIRPNPITKNPNMRGTGTGTGTGTGANRFPAPDPRTGRQDIRPNPITKSGSGNTNNSGVGSGGRTQNPPPQGKAKGQNNTQGTGTGTGTGGTGTGSGGSGSSGGSTGGSGS